MEKLRKKKVYSKHRFSDGDYISIPEIRLEGKWLEKLGFKEGMNLAIQAEPHRLTITVITQAIRSS